MLQRLATQTQLINLSLTETEINQVQNYTIGGIVSTAIAILMLVAGLIFFFMLVWGGVSWVTSGGDKGKTEAARNRITAALIGLVIVFAAWAIVSLVNLIFGVNILAFNIPSVVNLSN